ncbi:MAG: family 78 glycoside hydrolase catalytic domain [Candidatus Hydrogenedentota bacterium]
MCIIKRGSIAAAFAGAVLCTMTTCESLKGQTTEWGHVMGSLRATGLRCEHQVNPAAVDTDTPHLSWYLKAASAARGHDSTACRILVASQVSKLKPGHADLWDSNRLENAGAQPIAYAGEPLKTGERAYWSVRVWDAAGKPGPWAPPAWWGRGPDANAWDAQWIAPPESLPEDREALFEDQPAPRFRKSFVLDKPVRRAHAYVSGLGYYVLHINGGKVGDHVLDPAWTDYAERVFYTAHDVTNHLQPGENVVAMLAGNGWWNPLPLRMWKRINIRDAVPHGRPRVICRIDVEHTDGSRTRIVSDPAWKTADSAIRRNSVFLGERYDARRETPGWDAPGFDDTTWDNAVQAPEVVGPLMPQPMPPIRVTEHVPPVAMTECAPGVYVYDFGKNLAGRVRLSLSGPAGTTVQLRYGELLGDDGALNPMTAVCGQIKNQSVPDGSARPSTAEQRDVYILRGKGTETWAPRFTFHAFRYVEVTGWPGAPTLDSIVAERLNTDLAAAGTFTCSQSLFNDIQVITRNTFLSNIHGLQSDCPGREKFQYGGDIVATDQAYLYNFDMRNFYAKTVRDFADAQRPNGGFTETAPFVGIYDESLGEKAGPIGWGTAHPLLLDRIHRWYGNTALVADQYPRVQRWAEFLIAQAADGILDNGIGDHETIAPKDTAVSGTFFYIYNLHLAARLARIAGKEEDADRYDHYHKEAMAAFEQEFYDPGTGHFGNGTQASQCFGLALGLGGGKAVQALLDDIEANGYKLTTGIFGTRFLLPTLSQHGHHDAAVRIASQREMPSWGYMLDHGATTLWEHWAGSDNTFSQNHPMFGSISAWFFGYVLGIRPAPEAAGFDKALIAPEIGGGVDWARGTYESIRGPISVSWENREAELRLEIEMPPGVAAEVRLPVDDGETVHLDDAVAEEAEGVTLVAEGAGEHRYGVGAGSHLFRVVR